MAKQQDINAKFAVTDDTPKQTEEMRLAELKRQAEAIVAQESEKDLLEQLVAKARNRKAALDGKAEDELDDNGFPKKYFKINVHKGRDKNDLAYAPVQINGIGFKIQRGMDVIVPSVVLECLDHAVSETTTQIAGGLEFSAYMRFPYQNKGQVSEEEYIAFRDQMRALAQRQAA